MTAPYPNMDAEAVLVEVLAILHENRPEAAALVAALEGVADDLPNEETPPEEA